MPQPLRLALFLAAALALTACQSADERAEEHYQNALTLLQEGDQERALIELRNVFDLNGFHKEARALYAGTLVSRGEMREAYGQYLRLIEQYPDTAEVRRDLAQMAMVSGNWDEVERHGREALRLAPDDRVVQAIGLALDFRTAALADDRAGQEAVAARAADLLDAGPADQPANNLPGADQLLRRLIIDTAQTGPDPQSAMPMLDQAIAAEPSALDLQMLKLRLLALAQDTAGMGAQLQAMSAQFPDNTEVKTALIGWYMSQNDIVGAEAFLRAEAGDLTGPPEGHAAVIQLLQMAKGPEAARAELETLLAANTGTPNADLYGGLIASLDFEAGEQETAVAALEAIIAAAEPSDQTRRLKITQARMHEAMGNQVGARARIEEVLAEDAANVEALKMRAGWRIAADDPGGAIVDLRAALDQAPRDAQILTLMATAHEREGAPELAAERLALAVEVSGNAPEESLRYASLLMRDGRVQPAVSVLTDARQANPADPRLPGALAEIHLGQADWTRAEEMAAALEGIGSPEALTSAERIRAAILLGQNRTDEGLSLLSEQVGEAGDTPAVAAILETMVREGRAGEARSYLDSLITSRPDDRDLRMLSAALDALRGEAAAAETQYRDILTATPGDEAAARMLFGLLATQGRAEEARAVLTAALEAAPDNMTLLWMQASELQAAGDIEGAIAIYEAMYARDSGNAVIANNLASLITTFRDTPADLDRAWAVARRLRGATEPAFADTYGWIAFRRGEIDEALLHLEPAAAGLPEDPLVQYHYGMALAAKGRTDDARLQLARALEVAGPDTALPQMAEAAAKLAELGGPPAATPDPAPETTPEATPEATPEPAAPAPAPAATP
jgi:tetratricopeptide (TPR) repeat protein